MKLLTYVIVPTLLALSGLQVKPLNVLFFSSDDMNYDSTGVYGGPIKDITYVRMPQGQAYLCAVMDWYSCKVLGWAVSNTMGTSLCLEALEKALKSTGKVPEIFTPTKAASSPQRNGRVD